MQDRVSLYPGRVKLEPVAGQANTYDLTRADQPTQEGTPLNKASLLKDTTAALFGLGASAVPDDVMALLSRFNNGLGNEYVWEKNIPAHVSVGEPFDLVMGKSSSSSYKARITYGDSYTVDENGNFSLTGNVTNLTTAGYSTPTRANVLAGKYFLYNNALYKGTDGATGTGQTDGTYYWLQFNASQIFWVPDELVSYVNSPDSNAYPPAVSDGYTYTALGQLGNKVQMAIGTYTGTGTYGNSNPNSLTFDFTPKIVFISANTLSNGYGEIYLIKDCPCAMGTGSLMFQFVSFNGNTVSWYGNEETKQANYTGNIYYYIAIG